MFPASELVLTWACFRCRSFVQACPAAQLLSRISYVYCKPLDKEIDWWMLRMILCDAWRVPRSRSPLNLAADCKGTRLPHSCFVHFYKSNSTGCMTYTWPTCAGEDIAATGAEWLKDLGGPDFRIRCLRLDSSFGCFGLATTWIPLDLFAFTCWETSLGCPGRYVPPK